MSISVATAEAVIEAAQEEFDDEPAIYEGDMPEDDDTKIEEAEELIEQAKLAAADGWDNSAVDAILEAAEGDEGDDDEDESEEPWEGYDDERPSAIIKMLPDLDDDDLAEVYEYETGNKNRKLLVKALEKLADERQEDASDADEDDEDPESGPEITRQYVFELHRDDLEELIEERELDVSYNKRTSDEKLSEKICEALGLEEEDEDEEPDASAEDEDAEDTATPEEPEDLDPPWRGYDSRKMEQIIRKLPKLDDEELAEVYDYESANKNRQGIMKALAKIAAERQPDPEPEEEEETEESPEDGYTWEDLVSFDKDELKNLIDLNDLDVSKRGNADTLREKIAEALDIEPDEDDDDDPEDDPAEEETSGREDPEDDPDDDDEHRRLVAKIKKRVDEEFFSIPAKLPQEIVELPFDLTQESDEAIRRLHSAFTSYFARAAYVAKLEGQLADACKHIGDKKHAEVMASLPRIDEETKKEKNVTLLKAEAENDPTVELWRDRHLSHSMMASNSKKDCDIYEKNISSLSREWTMRHEEYEHTGGLTKKKPGRVREGK